MDNVNDKPYRILLPKIDVIFKLLFGDSRNIEILTGFLQSVLNIEEDEYESISVVDPILKKESLEDKYGIVDVRLITKSGMIVHIEIQVVDLEEMPERIVYYNSKMLVNQLKAGDSYSKIQKTISIVIVDFNMIKNSTNYKHKFRLVDEITGIQLTDVVEIHTLELTKIPTASDNTHVYDWLRFLKAEEEEEFMMVAEKDPIIHKAYAELKRLSLDEENQLIYEARQKAIADEESRLRSAEKRAEKRGEERGQKMGEREAINKIAQMGIIQNVDLSILSSLTGMSVEELEKMKAKP